MSEVVEASPPSARYVGYVILLLCAVNLFNYVDRMALAVLAPLIKVDLKLSDAQLGLLTGFSFALFYAVCAIPIARWADRGSRRDIIVIALTVWSAMTALSGAAQSFWHLFVARVGVGMGEAGSYAPGASIVCDYVPLARRSGAFAIFNFGNAAGIMIGMALAGLLGATIGWRWAFVALGLPGIALALLLRFTLREPVRGRLDETPNSAMSSSLADTMLLLWRCRTYRSLVLFLVANGFVQYGFHQWWPSFYSRTFAMDLSTVGLYLGVAIGVGMGIGMLVGAFIANRTALSDVRRPLAIGAAATCLSIPTVLASLWISSVKGSIVLVALTGFFWGVSNGPVIAAKYSVVSSRIRATAGAVAILFISVLGFGLGPFTVGVLSDRLAPSLGLESLRYALHAPACLIPLMVVALLAAAKSLPNDLAQSKAFPLSGHLVKMATVK